MLKLLIVEDEKIEREALFSLMKDNFSNYFSDIYVVNNGEDAYHVFCEHKCEIVLSDINIPKMSGLELIKKIKEQNSLVKCLILTSHNYFEYAQEAIRIGVSDFILKPSQDAEILNRVKKAINDYNKSENDKKPSTISFNEIQSVIESDCIYALLANESADKISFFLNILNVHMKYGFCMIFKKRNVDFEKLTKIIVQYQSNSLSILCAPYIDFYIMYLLNDKVIAKERITYTQDVLKNCFQDITKIGFGGIKENVEDLHDSFLEAMDKMNKLERVGIRQELKMNSYSTIEEFINTVICEIEKAIKQQDMRGLIKLIDSSYEYVESNRKNFDEFLRLFIVRLKEKMNPDIVFDIASIKLPIMDNKKDEKIYMTYVMRTIIGQYMNDYRKNMNILVIEAYKFISMNYMKSIALNDLAEYLDVTPQYISSLLSKVENNNFTNLVAEYRIEKAKELLIANVNIKKVADMVGFQNHNYFTNVFKKKTGCTPKEYINNSNS